MISKNRSTDVVRPRQVAMCLCNQLTDSFLQSIGAYMGNRDKRNILREWLL